MEEERRKQLWRLLNMEEERRKLAAIPEAFAAVDFILNQKERKREMMAILLYFIWAERNKIREEGKRRPAEVIARGIELYEAENVMTSYSARLPAAAPRQKWLKPPVDLLKLNVDGSFKQMEKEGSWGFIIWDSDGELVLAGRGKVDHLMNAFQAELIACLQGLQGAADVGIANVILETDAMEVVTALNSTKYDDSVMGHTIEEIKFQARQNFVYFSCIHVSRQCNSAAHELANLGYLCSEGEGIIADSVPDDIAVIVANDLLAS